MIYYPHVPGRSLEQTPADIGLCYEDLRLQTSDGLSLHAWFLHSPKPTRLTLLFFHGNAGNISHRLSKCCTFLDLGLDVLLVDYRGYGQSEGRPDEAGTYLDATAAYDYLTQQRSISPEKIVIYGESLGTGIAADLAPRVPIGGVILEASFTSIADVAQRMFWFLPVRRLVRNHYDSLSKVKHIQSPLLLLHSRDDEIFNIRHSQRLLGAAAEPKRLVELRGKHADAFYESIDICRSAIQEFLTPLK